MLQSSTCFKQDYGHPKEVKFHVYSIWFRHSLLVAMVVVVVVVKALRYKSEGPEIDSRCRRVFFVASKNSMCPGVDSASKNEYQGNTVGKGGRCFRLTTNNLHVPIVKISGGLNHLEPCGPVQA